MRVIAMLAALACVFNLSVTEPAGATQEGGCTSGREWCDNSCTVAMEVQALRCSFYGFTTQAAICHAENMADYGGCLSECRQVWGSTLYSNQVE